METTTTHMAGDDESWAPITDVARCLKISANSMHNWGKAGEFGYRQLTPKQFVVCVPEVLSFYTSKFPRIEINHNAINAVLQSTA